VATILAIATFGIAVSIQLIALNVSRSPAGRRAYPDPEAAVGRVRYAAQFQPVVPLPARGAGRWNLLALERILRSPWGRVLKAIREDETARLRSARARAAFAWKRLCSDRC
jgi:branched-chain amino acid transport system permease protein